MYGMGVFWNAVGAIGWALFNRLRIAGLVRPLAAKPLLQFLQRKTTLAFVCVAATQTPIMYCGEISKVAAHLAYAIAWRPISFQDVLIGVLPYNLPSSKLATHIPSRYQRLRDV